MASSRKLRPAAALATYVESLVEGRRVVIFGDATSGLAELIEDRGARIVHVYDPDPARVAEATARNASRSISYAALPPSGLAARDGAFELGIVDDLNSTGPAHSIVGRMRRALAPRGVALVAIPNPNVERRLLSVSVPTEGALDYYELYDTLKGEFSHVRMLGQAPFVGYAVVDFAAGSPDPSLDSTLVPGGAEEPEWFIGVASDGPVALDEFAVVQMPLAETWPTTAAAPARADGRSERIVARLEAETERLRRELQGADDAGTQLGELRSKLADQDKWVQELESRLSIADERADDAYSEIEALRAQKPEPAAPPTRLPEDAQRLRQLEADAVNLARELERSALSARGAQDELAAANAKLSETSAKLDAERAKLAAANAKLAAANAKLEALETTLREERAAADSQGSDDNYEREVAALEKQLSERGAAIQKLQRDLTTLERLGRELLIDLEERGEGGGTDATALKAQLDALARATAEREADLEAARWTIQALEGQLSGGDGPSSELQEARAELARQATLIAQLKAHGSA